MFLSLSKTLAKFGGFHFGIRISKKNAPWMLFIMMFVWMFQLCWYMMVLCFWLIYAVIYGLWWCIRRIFRRKK